MALDDDQFPAGLRVLVVDDDVTCLKLLETLLQRCKFVVTTTTKAREALKMLKDKKRKFDIVISDVEMPDMDGIKLLQLVGLEMDIPVIMLSAYSDTRRVLQGVRNGAVDYLVKPVRIQELQNIWQHVVRRKAAIGSTSGFAGKSNASRDKNDKGKNIEENPTDDMNDNNNNNDGDNNDDDEGSDEGGRDIDDPATHKKPRLFWSLELHQKFVDAVNQLGPDKAFPKKILDLMDVEGLTREKVASHLQKYRLYLRKVNTGPTQPETRYGAVGAEDPHIGSLGGGYGVYRSLAGTGRFPGHPSLPDAGQVLGHLNTTSALSLRSITSAPTLQTPLLTNSSNAFNTIGKYDPLSPSGNRFQGVPAAMQMNKTPYFGPSNTPLMITGNQQLNTGGFNSQSPLFQSASNPGALGVGANPNMMLDATSKPNWETTVQPGVQALSFTQNVVPTAVSSDVIAAPNSQIQNDQLDMFCGMPPLEDPNGNVPSSQEFLNGFNNFSSLGPIWPNLQNNGNMSNTSSSLVPATAPTAVDNVRKSTNNMIAASPFNQFEGVHSQTLLRNEVQQAYNNEKGLLDEPKLLCSSSQSNNTSEYLEDIVGSFLRQGNGDAGKARDDLGFDPYRMQ